MQRESFRIRKLVHAIGPALGLVLLLVALWRIRHTLHGYHYTDIVQAVQTVSFGHVMIALGFTALSYFFLTLYDVLAFRYVAQRMPYRRLAMASFVGFALSNNVGHSYLSGGAIRYRLYSNWGVGAVDIARVIAFCMLTGWVGFATLGGIACLDEPRELFASTAMPPGVIFPLGVVLIVLPGAYVLLALTRRAALRVRSWEFTLPPPLLAAAQIAVGVSDLTVAAAVFYVLMPVDATLSFPAFAGIFILSLLAGLISQVPGGLGVFETVMIALLGPHVPPDKAIGALLLFRIVYYLIPLFAAASVLAAYELRQRRAMLLQVTATLGVVSPLIPHLFAFLTLVCGALLLFSGATPAVHGRMEILRDLLPLPVVEISHFLASIIGVALIILARALMRRLDAAYWLTVVLLMSGIVLSLLKGLDYEEALVLSVMLAAFVPCHREFYRKASLLKPQFGPEWIVAIASIVVCAVWLGAFAYKHVEYSHEMWWQFTLDGHVPRFLRATVGGIGLLLLFAFATLLRPARAKHEAPGPQERALVRRVASESPRVTSNLALLGDKEFLFNDAESAFIMYGTAERCWVSMGDPVGPDSEKADLVWQFRELCDRRAAWPVFYQVHPDNLYLYPDIGLVLFKFGEEARVDLTSFSLAGAARKTERNVLHRLDKDGYRFEIVPREEVPAILPALKGVSDAWLEHKNSREKGFSLGYFDEAYLSEFPQALLRKEGRIIAFANLWEGAGKRELSVDLMRYGAGAPNSAMEGLLLQLMQWGAAEGYHWFNLGMAPLAGVESRTAAPLWNRMASFVYRHGEHFYSFQGLRLFKEKFHPVWEPRYIASPGGIAFPRVLADIASLVNRGIAGTVAK